MLLTIHNFPSHMRYGDIKTLLLSKCGLKEVILDNLVNEGRTKKVTVGLAEEEDAAIVVRQINGLFLEGKQLYVEDVRKKKVSEQPYRQTNRNFESSNSDIQRKDNQQFSYSPQPSYAQQMTTMTSQQGEYPNQMAGYQPDNMVTQQFANPGQIMPLMMPLMGPMNMGSMFYTPQLGQNPYTDYASQTQWQQFPPTASQYPAFSGQQGKLGSDNSLQTPKDDKWTRDRRNQPSAEVDNDTAYGNKSSYKSDTRQQSGGWHRGTGDDDSRRSRTPGRKRERSLDRSRNSPKRSRWEGDHTNRDSSRKTEAYSNRDSQRQYDRNDTYTSQTYSNSPYNSSFSSQTYDNSGNVATYTSQRYSNNSAFNSSSDQNKTYSPQSYNKNDSSSYHNEPVSQWSTGTDNPIFQQQWTAGFSRSAPAEDESKASNWNDRNTIDPLSNYRKQMQLKAQSRSKPGENTRDSKNTSSYGRESQPQNSWRNQDHGKYDNKSSRWGGQTNASTATNASEEGKAPNKHWEWERPSFDRNASKAKKPNKPNKIKVPLMPSIKSDMALRFKAAGEIAYHISKDNPDLISKECMQHLKQSVRSRLEILLAEKLGVSRPQMVSIYREKFPKSQDRNFCKIIAEEVQANSGNIVDLTGPDGKTGAQPIAGNSQPTSGNTQPNKRATRRGTRANPNYPVVPRLNLQQPEGKLPKYPNADKQVYKEQKKLKKLEHENEDLYTLPPLLHEALEEELKNITDFFKSVVSKPDTDQEKGLCERFLQYGLNQVRKIVKVNVTKRLLKIHTNLIVRVFTTGKPPKKTEVELFLRRLKVVSLKKSDRKKIVYMATCPDFETYDHLLALETTPLNNETMLKFKPFQLAGPKLSFRERNLLRTQRFQSGNQASANQDFTNDDDFDQNFADDEINEGQDDHEEFEGQVGNEEFEGQDGNDEFEGQDSHEEFEGPDGNDESQEQDGNEEIQGHGGDEEIQAQDVNKEVQGQDDAGIAYESGMEDMELNEDDLEDY